MLRKVLTKKGTGKGHEVKEAIHNKFIAGCIEKGIGEKKGQELWEKFEFFSGYGFNKSHAVCYSVISYQCAWLLTYYEAEWLAAFLDKEPEKRKETAISLAKSFGYEIAPLDINKSGRVWEISEDGKTLSNHSQTLRVSVTLRLSKSLTTDLSTMLKTYSSEKRLFTRS